MPFDGSDIYQLASRLSLPSLERAARAAGVMSVLEISAYYVERRVRHSVARVIEYQLGEIELHVAYEGVRLETIPRIALEASRIEKLNAVLLAAKFQSLSDQPDLSYDERCLWLIQGAAGAHIHGIMVAPDRPVLPYATIVNAIDQYLPEAIREVPLRSA
ncbi:MAG: hypothetical protein OXG53_08260 [Chloroflexi bacterium]|nr:hypothetical protein [Chloroflexota bacterium]